MAPYPSDLERPGLLRDGRSIMIRPSRPVDLDALSTFFGRLSRRTVSFRMLGPVVTMDRARTAHFLDADHDQRLNLLATLDDEVIGIAEYARQPDNPDRADIAFTVEDGYQGIGLGGLLMEHLAAAARERGIAVFEADVLAENMPMLRAFESSGYRLQFGPPGSVQHVDIAVDPRRQVLARSDRRMQTATRSSLHAIFAPRSVAVVGASRERRNVGHAILRNLQECGFAGPLYAVNPKATEIAGIPSVPSVRDAGGPVDMAVVAVPAGMVPQVLADCAAHDVGAVVVVSTEMDARNPQGRELLQFARGHGMRLVGPNCMGVVSLRPDVDLVATFSPVVPPRGRVAMASQSGPLGLAVLDHAHRLGLGFSGFVSLGDSLDVSPNDLLQWWEADPATSLVLLHLEAFGNPRTFARTARRVAARKPIIAVHPGTTAPAPDPAEPESAARPADSDTAVDTLFTQAGIIRTRTMQEMFDTALLLAHQPVPAGSRVAVLTNAGGPGALTAGACRGAGLGLARLTAETTAALPERTRGDTANPVDLTPEATGADYRRALAALLADPGVDAVVVLFIPPLVDESEAVAEAIVAAAATAPAKPVLASFLSRAGLSELLRSPDGRSIPSYLFPESAAVALGHAARYGEWLRRPAGVVRDPADSVVRRARELLAGRGVGPLDPAGTAELLRCFDFRVAPGTTPPEGQDLILDVSDDPLFGPVVTLGAVGEYARLLGDVGHRITPVSNRDAEALVRGLPSYPRLRGGLDRPGVDVDALVAAVQQVSAMVESLPELAELRVGGLRVGVGDGGVVFDDVSARLQKPTAARRVREATVDPG
ncbi:GNAT family N-acetyltransferase [Pseudonocardia sp. NPDC049154]|uniref:bifunctional acetate--CoA ligase family protein/GNAT family N-acetyltransferase n=1 Tax=Pseudonocardia sp. NPDC049154 TaxID=3155501 RepID=UPI0033C8FD3D